MSNFNRRTFPRTADADIALGVAAPGMVVNASPNYAIQNKSKYPSLRYDVAVVGAGASSIPVAIAAEREGAKVILLEEDMQTSSSSFRVQPIAAAIGEAAGVAAAMTAFNNTNLRDIEIKKLTAHLDAKGMFEVYKNFTQ